MDKFYHLLGKIFLTLFVVFLITSCSKVTQSNFDKIKPNMTMQEVITILGEPSSSDSINIAGISGTSAVWQSHNAEINIQFLNNRVTIKAFNKPSTKPSAEAVDTQ
jgi:hypothetical protein